MKVAQLVFYWVFLSDRACPSHNSDKTQKKKKKSPQSKTTLARTIKVKSDIWRFQTVLPVHTAVHLSAFLLRLAQVYLSLPLLHYCSHTLSFCWGRKQLQTPAPLLLKTTVHVRWLIYTFRHLLKGTTTTLDWKSDRYLNSEGWNIKNNCTKALRLLAEFTKQRVLCDLVLCLSFRSMHYECGYKGNTILKGSVSQTNKNDLLSHKNNYILKSTSENNHYNNKCKLWKTFSDWSKLRHT